MGGVLKVSVLKLLPRWSAPREGEGSKLLLEAGKKHCGKPTPPPWRGKA